MSLQQQSMEKREPSLIRDPLDKLATIAEGEPNVDKLNLIETLEVTSEAELIQITTRAKK